PWPGPVAPTTVSPTTWPRSARSWRRAASTRRPRAGRRALPPPTGAAHCAAGEHAYGLAGAVVRGWPPERYTEPNHPLQAVVGDTLADFTGSPIEHVGVDGCGG